MSSINCDASVSSGSDSCGERKINCLGDNLFSWVVMAAGLVMVAAVGVSMLSSWLAMLCSSVACACADAIACACADADDDDAGSLDALWFVRKFHINGCDKLWLHNCSAVYANETTNENKHSNENK